MSKLLTILVVCFAFIFPFSVLADGSDQNQSQSVQTVTNGDNGDSDNGKTDDSTDEEKSDGSDDWIPQPGT